jgi:hypothetical protein
MVDNLGGGSEKHKSIKKKLENRQMLLPIARDVVISSTSSAS